MTKNADYYEITKLKRPLYMYCKYSSKDEPVLHVLNYEYKRRYAETLTDVDNGRFLADYDTCDIFGCSKDIDVAFINFYKHLIRNNLDFEEYKEYITIRLNDIKRRKPEILI